MARGMEAETQLQLETFAESKALIKTTPKSRARKAGYYRLIKAGFIARDEMRREGDMVKRIKRGAIRGASPTYVARRSQWPLPALEEPQAPASPSNTDAICPSCHMSSCEGECGEIVDFDSSETCTTCGGPNPWNCQTCGEHPRDDSDGYEPTIFVHDD
jgi:hypothetical protein